MRCSCPSFLLISQFDSLFFSCTGLVCVLEVREDYVGTVLDFTSRPEFSEPFGRLRVPFPVRQRVGASWDKLAAPGEDSF